MTDPKSFRHFAKHLFLTSRVYVGRNKAKDEVDNQLKRMRKQVIKMSLSYSDIDRLKRKVNNLINLERKYAKFFKPEDEETRELRKEIAALERELQHEREEKHRLIAENDEKIRRLKDSLAGVHAKMNELTMHNTIRKQRHLALDRKIMEKVDMHKFYHS